ncbi:DUF6705 family protein [Flavobacterium sp.]|uniref:DUF6705 family protein n=1 Tax=Flavobacterium sp. TaxID=239 RepID=UPI001B6AB981|nr:DUF6705 family protein [Flavobacterium sp.]MBP6127954.1 hypothetical protein [Flavobacterium sp.]
MKTIKIIIIALLSLHCKAQNPVVDVTESELGLPDGYYVKDMNLLLNPFEGTYLYTNGNTTFKIILVKKEQQYNGRYYEDLIIGEYFYTNGVDTVDTLNEINTVYNDQRSHSIDGNWVVNNNFRYWKCPTCPANEKRLCCGIKDISTNNYAQITMRRTVEAGQEVMKIKISHVMARSYNVDTEPVPPDFSLLLGEYTLIKQ